jgi:hypothetical protein
MYSIYLLLGSLALITLALISAVAATESQTNQKIKLGNFNISTNLANENISKNLSRMNLTSLSHGLINSNK